MQLGLREPERHNINDLLNPNHIPVFKSVDPELLVYGGAGAGKSYTIADKLLLAPRFQPKKKLKGVVIRKTFPSLRTTALDILGKRAEALRVPFDINKSEWVARSDGLTLHFQSLNNKEDYQKLKSLTDVDFVWVNELPEIRETDYDEIRRRVRGGDSSYSQIISDFNPIGKTTWVYKRFFEKNIGKVPKLRYTIKDNHPAYLRTKKGEHYLALLESYKEFNINNYKIYFLGEWGELKGVIFDWDIVPGPPENPDEIIYGGDFGYSVNEAALIKVYRKADEFWVEQVIYEAGLTNEALAKRAIQEGVDPKSYIYWDCAEPKSIDEVINYGLIGSKPCIKGPGSVKTGIDYLKSLKIHIIDGSENIKTECRSYVYKEDKDGNSLEIPIEFNDHAMSAIRYAIYTHMRDSGQAVFMWTEKDLY